MKERDIFDAALAIADPGERDAFLSGACDGDSGLMEHVRGLLDMQRKLGSFLEAADSPPTMTIESPPLTEGPGSVIGLYKLLEQIGEGGMGVVYMAEQTKPVRRKVALKIIKPGMDTKQVIARFEAERQALAMMDHPNIARVLDAGATESGRPYFVMELVRGIPIVDYCDRNHLAIDDRLELFVLVCQAVQHAHQKGIIHRDLKPSNVMVTMIDGAAVPKVIDFGVVKAMGQQLTEKTLFTSFAQLIGTPLYMSPEQAEFSGVDVDTRSDIYSLGVLLYELLTGTTPFDQERFRTAAYDEIRRIIREEEPPKPSTRISTLEATATVVSANRGSDPSSLGKLIRGELDWIVMRALDKDRRRRYETASAFAADVQRYLADEPVQACPPSTWYRLSKAARRNRVALVTSALVATTLMMATALSTWQAVRARRAERKTAAALMVAESRRTEAEEQRRQARRAVDDMYTQVALKWLAKQPQMEPLQREFLEKALAFYTAFAEQTSLEPDVRRETALAYRRVGEIQAELQQYPEATAAYRQAITVQEALAVDRPAWADLRHELAHSHNSLGRLSDTILETDRAEREYVRAAALFRALSEATPENAEYRLDLATVAHNLGLMLSKIDRPEEGHTALSQAIDQMEQLVEKYPAHHDFRRMLAAFSSALGTVLQGTGHPGEAEAAFLKTITQMKALVSDRRGSPDDLNVLGGALHNLGRLRSHQGDLAQACPLLREAIVHEKAALDGNPRHAGTREYLRNHYWALAATLIRLGDHAEAARTAEEVPSLGPGNSMNATIASDLLFDCSEAARKDEKLPEPQRLAVAEGYLLTAKTLIRTTAELSRERAVHLSGLAWYLSVTPRTLLRDPSLSLDLAERAVRLEPNNSSGWEALGLARYRNGRWSEALQAFGKGAAIDGEDTTMNFIQAMACHHLGDRDRATEFYRKAIARLSQGGVPSDIKLELEDFRAEATALLGMYDLPADVFARP